uniref:Flagellar motor switch protein FliG n=1 Tax=Haemonchus contortus TaxID=6289 RepID=A0A7I4Y2W6_HAECO
MLIVLFLVVLVELISTRSIGELDTHDSELLEESDIQGLEEFLMGVDDERTREAVIELLEAKQIADEKQAEMRMRRIIRQLPPDVITHLFEIYKSTFPR